MNFLIFLNFLLILCYFKFLDFILSEMKIYWRLLEIVKMLLGFKNILRKCLLVLLLLY